MIEVQELRVGNWVQFWVWGKMYTKTVKTIDSEGINLDLKGSSYEAYLEDVKGILLTEDWLLRMKGSKYKDAFPDWIQYVHEAQNWYFWNHNKTELTITKD